MNEPQKIIDTHSAANMLGISITAVNKLAQDGTLHWLMDTTGKKWILEQEIMEMLKAKEGTE